MSSIFRKSPKPRGKRIFFATDVHGSERCFRKFVNAGQVYGVDYLVLGGDITGKLMVPIVRQANGTYACRYGDAAHADLDASAAEELRKRIRGFGHYTVTLDEDELGQLEDEASRDRVFREVVRKSVEDWVALAEERLRGTGIRCFMAPGNDDFLSIDAPIEASTVVEFAENRLLQLDDVHEMITTGYANPTPWHTERELPEPDLRVRIDSMAADVRDPENLIAVLHPPPYHSGLDDAPELNENLEMTLNAGGVKMMPVGSTAVRQFIEDTQPLLGLHGHVHEGRGTVSIGKTFCLNPGSSYTEGILSGAIVEIGPGQILSCQFVNG